MENQEQRTPEEENKKPQPTPLEPGQLKPKNEGINNTDVPEVPESKRAQNNPTGQDEGLSGGGGDPLADL